MPAKGRSCKTYYNSSGSYDSPTWVELTKIIDETTNPANALATGGSREDLEDVNEVVGRSFEWSAGWRYRKHNEGADAVYAALLAAFGSGDAVDMLFLDDSVTVAGAKGWRAPIVIDQFPMQRNLGDLVQVDLHGVATIKYESGGARRKMETFVSTGEVGGTTTGTTTSTTAGI